MAKSTTRKTLADFPAFVSANDKLAELTQQKSAADTALREAHARPRENHAEVISAEAAALIDDGAVAVLDSPDVTELQRKSEVLAEAIRLQKTRVDEHRLAAAREISAERRPAFNAAVQEFLRLQTEAIEQYDRFQSLAAECQQETGGASLLPVIAFDPRVLAQFRMRFADFKSIVQEMVR